MIASPRFKSTAGRSQDAFGDNTTPMNATLSRHQLALKTKDRSAPAVALHPEEFSHEISYAEALCWALASDSTNLKHWSFFELASRVSRDPMNSTLSWFYKQPRHSSLARVAVRQARYRWRYIAIAPSKTRVWERRPRGSGIFRPFSIFKRVNYQRPTYTSA